MTAVPEGLAAPRTRKSKSAFKDEATTAHVRITHPDRVLWQDVGITKLELARYYAAIAPRLLAQAGRRPISLVRCPNGPDGQCFFQRHVTDGMSPHVYGVKVPGHGEGKAYIYVDDAEGLREPVCCPALEFACVPLRCVGSVSPSSAASVRGARKRLLPGFVATCDPTLRDTPPSGKEWLYEIKADGYRLQLHVARSGQVVVYSRTGLDWTKQFATIAEAAQALRRGAFMNGEPVVYGKNPPPPHCSRAADAEAAGSGYGAAGCLAHLKNPKVG